MLYYRKAVVQIETTATIIQISELWAISSGGRALDF